MFHLARRVPVFQSGNHIIKSFICLSTNQRGSPFRSLNVHRCYAANPYTGASEETTFHVKRQREIPPEFSELLLQGHELHKKRTPLVMSDKVAFYLASGFDGLFSRCYRTRFIHQAIIHETVSGVGGIVAAFLRHMRTLRTLDYDGHRISTLLDESDNERMHLLFFLSLIEPGMRDRTIVITAQIFFGFFYGNMYFLSPKFSHRFMGYFYEHTVERYSDLLLQLKLKKLDDMRVKDPLFAKYWALNEENALLSDVIREVRTDELQHRDINHFLADQFDSLYTTTKST